MLHEQRTIEVHDIFWRRVCAAVPELKKSEKWYLISDDKAGFVVNVQKHLPNAVHVRCWNHVFQNIERKLLKLQIKDDEVAAYKNDIKKILLVDNTADYYRRYFEVCGGWNQVNKDVGQP